MREYKVSVSYTNGTYTEAITIGDSDIEKYKNSIIQDDVFIFRLSNGKITIAPLRHVYSVCIDPKI